MRPLTPDDLLPLAEYTARRAEFAEVHRAYCERYRRVRLGSHIELLFENRQTLWYRTQELLRVMHTEDPAIVRAELDACSRLLPRKRRVLARVVASQSGIRQNLDPVYESACLRIDEMCVDARSLPLRPEDRPLGVSAWIEFGFSAAERTRFADFRCATSIEVIHSGKRHDSGTLADEVRVSLIDDLKIGEREAA